MDANMLGAIAVICGLGSISIVVSARYRNLQKSNIILKMKLTDLALQTNNDIYAVYTISREDKAKIKAFKTQNNKIEAIKILKNKYYLSLFEAKCYIDRV